MDTSTLDISTFIYGAVFLFAIYQLYIHFRRPKNHWNLKGKVILVTGASRGVGKGIAEALGDTGATIYVTGRSLAGDNTLLPGRTIKGENLPGTITETVQNINRRGGVGIAVKVDHSNDEEIKQLFQKIEREQGRLDILINNVINIRTDIKQSGPFWEQPIPIWDSYHQVGLRCHYVACVEAVPLMLKSPADCLKMIINVSSIGSTRYLFNVSYGTAKSAFDRMTKDMAVDLRRTKIMIATLWPGMVKTERMAVGADVFASKYGVDINANGESPEFTGRAIAALAEDKGRLTKSGKILSVDKLSYEYNFTDVNGSRPPQMYSWRFMLQNATSYFAARQNRRTNKTV